MLLARIYTILYRTLRPEHKAAQHASAATIREISAHWHPSSSSDTALAEAAAVRETPARPSPGGHGQRRSPRQCPTRTARGDGAVPSPPWRRADAWQRRRSCGPGDPGPSESGQSQQTGRGKVTRSCRSLGGELTPALQRRRGCGPRDPGPSASVRSPRLGRPEMTARSCRRLGGALTPGSAGAAAVRETPARPRPCSDGAVMSLPRLRCHNSSLL